MKRTRVALTALAGGLALGAVACLGEEDSLNPNTADLHVSSATEAALVTSGKRDLPKLEAKPTSNRAISFIKTESCDAPGVK